MSTTMSDAVASAPVCALSTVATSPNTSTSKALPSSVLRKEPRSTACAITHSPDSSYSAFMTVPLTASFIAALRS